MILWRNIENFHFFIILIPTPDFPNFYYMLGAKLGSLLYGDVSVMMKHATLAIPEFIAKILRNIFRVHYENDVEFYCTFIYLTYLYIVNISYPQMLDWSCMCPYLDKKTRSMIIFATPISFNSMVPTPFVGIQEFVN